MTDDPVPQYTKSDLLQDLQIEWKRTAKLEHKLEETWLDVELARTATYEDVTFYDVLNALHEAAQNDANTACDKLPDVLGAKRDKAVKALVACMKAFGVLPRMEFKLRVKSRQAP